jgi:hypothetical protein
MNAAILLLSISYAVPLALAGLALAMFGRWRRTLTTLLVLLPAFYLLHYQGLKQLAGWPVEIAPPDEFNLLSELVREPDPQNGDGGAMYFWINTPAEPTPRAIELPYSKPLHRAVDEAAQRRSQGKPQQAVKRETVATGTGRAPGSGDRVYEFRDIPGRRLPPKGGEAD